MEHKRNGDSNCNWCTWKNPQRNGVENGRLENKRTNTDFTDNRIIKIDSNTEKSPGDLRRLAVTKTSARNYLLKLIRSTLKSKINSNISLN